MRFKFEVFFRHVIGRLTLLFGSFGLSTKEPYTIMLCPLLASALASLVLVSVLASVHASPWHRIRHRNFIFGAHMSPIYARQIFSDSDL